MWQVFLKGKTHYQVLCGGKEPVPVPPDEYEVELYEEWHSEYPKRAGACIIVPLRDGPRREIEVVADKLTELKIGSPVEGRIKMDKSRDGYGFYVQWYDIGGSPIHNMTGLDFPRVLDLIDPKGKVADKIDIPYGWAEWKNPQGLRGDYTASVEGST